MSGRSTGRKGPAVTARKSSALPVASTEQASIDPPVDQTVVQEEDPVATVFGNLSSSPEEARATTALAGLPSRFRTLALMSRSSPGPERSCQTTR
jgi:hypothetical protein